MPSASEELNSKGDAAPTFDVTLVLPCLNEELAIAICVQRALDTFSAANLNGQVLVVDNGSTDRSVELALEAGARVIHQHERGYGAALRSGIEHAESELVVMADGDGTYELEAIPKLLAPLISNEADLVMGSRLDDATKGTMPFLHRYVGTPSISLLIRWATQNRIEIRDSQSGFRAFRRDEILNLGLLGTGMEFASEMLIHSIRAKFRIVEIPTSYAPRIGESKLQTFRDGFRHLRQILLLSPEMFAIVPGILMTLGSIALWVMASFSDKGHGRIGSWSWVAILVAGIFSIIGPITYCTGSIIKYRAESLGFRHSHPRYPLSVLIWRYFYAGCALVGTALVLTITLVTDYHQHPHEISVTMQSTLGSITRSSAVVGIMLVCAPVLLPFFTQHPVAHLPETDPEQ